MNPRIAEERRVEGEEPFPEAGQLQQPGAFGHEEANGELHRRHALHELQFHEPLEQREVAFQGSPRGERDKGRCERNAGCTRERDGLVEVAAGVVLVEMAQDLVVHGFHGGGDEQASARAQLGQ